MPRSVALCAVAVLSLGVAVVRPPAAAQDATPAGETGTHAATAGHPLVGAWVLDTDAADPANPPSYAVFHADGTYLEAHPLVGIGVGAWRPTGERTADLAIVFQDVDPSPAGVAPGALTVRAAVEVAPDGATLTAPYASEGRAPDGAVLFVAAFTATGTRLQVAAMATPGGATPVP